MTATQWNPARSKLLLVAVVAPTEIGRRIKAAREKRGWTQLAFALEANVSPSSVARWEAGKLPPVRELVRLADLLEVSPETLVEPDPVGAERAAEIAEIRQGLSDLQEMKATVERIEAWLRAREEDPQDGSASA